MDLRSYALLNAVQKCEFSGHGMQGWVQHYWPGSGGWQSCNGYIFHLLVMLCLLQGSSAGKAVKCAQQPAPLMFCMPVHGDSNNTVDGVVTAVHCRALVQQHAQRAPGGSAVSSTTADYSQHQWRGVATPGSGGKCQPAAALVQPCAHVMQAAAPSSTAAEAEGTTAA
jgi:hypothetical protein